MIGIIIHRSGIRVGFREHASQITMSVFGEETAKIALLIILGIVVIKYVLMLGTKASTCIGTGTASPEVGHLAVKQHNPRIGAVRHSNSGVVTGELWARCIGETINIFTDKVICDIFNKGSSKKALSKKKKRQFILISLT